MEFLIFDVEINPWESRTYEIIARAPQSDLPPGPEPQSAVQPLWNSARTVSRFPLSPNALAVRLPALRNALAQMDLAAGRSDIEDEWSVSEFASLLHSFIFTGEILRVFNQARSVAVSQWKGLRLRLRISAPDLQLVPWEVLWDILAFDLQSLRRGLFDLRIERIAPYRMRPTINPQQPAGPLHPLSIDPRYQQVTNIIRQADAAFYSPNFSRAIELYHQSLHLAPSLRQARECLARAEACLHNRLPTTTVPPRAAAGYQRAWDTYTQYRFEEAQRWLNEACLLAKDWGIAEWPEADTFRAQIERSLSGYANYQEGLSRFDAGDFAGALEAIEQAFHADPLEVYHAQLEDWWKIFELGKENTA